jgi:hypothetical protein
VLVAALTGYMLSYSSRVNRIGQHLCVDGSKSDICGEDPKPLQKTKSRSRPDSGLGLSHFQGDSP